MKFTKFVPIHFVCLFILFWATAAYSDESNPWAFLPTQTINIVEGEIAFQSALIVDARRPLNNPMFQNYPTKYILPVTNKSKSTIWIEVEWRISDEEIYINTGKLKPNNFGVFFRKIDDIAWDKPIAIRASIYADEKKASQLGERILELLFHGGKDKELFMKKAEEVNSVTTKMGHASGAKVEIPLLPGFP